MIRRDRNSGFNEAASPVWLKALGRVVIRWFTAAPNTRQRPGLSGRGLPPTDRADVVQVATHSVSSALIISVYLRETPAISPFYDAGRARRLFAPRHVTGMDFLFFPPVRAERPNDTTTAEGNVSKLWQRNSQLNKSPTAWALSESLFLRFCSVVVLLFFLSLNVNNLTCVHTSRSSQPGACVKTGRGGEDLTGRCRRLCWVAAQKLPTITDCKVAI